MGLQEFEGSFQYRSSWQHTYLTAVGLRDAKTEPSSSPLKVQGFYSDILYQPCFCATTPIREEWLERDNLERRSSLSAEEFRQQYELPNCPVVLTDAVRSPLWLVSCINSSWETRCMSNTTQFDLILHAR